MQHLLRGASALALLAGSLSLWCASGVGASGLVKLVPSTPCSHANLREHVMVKPTTLGAAETFEATIENLSSVSCSIAVGPTSPMMTLVDPTGTTVWNSCYTSNGPGACAEFLALITLKPRATYSRTTQWQPTSSTSPATGRYTLSASFSGVDWTESTSFTLLS